MAIKAMLLLISFVILTTANAACWREGLFECSNGQRCLNGNKICDTMQDCEDNSDEANCTQANCNAWLTYTKTLFTEAEIKQSSVMPEDFYPRFACTDGQTCLSGMNVCDGYPQCDDGSDEGNCLDRCPPKYFPCADGTRCLGGEQVCDGLPDCEDESDEGDCTDDESCGQGRFRCDDGLQCIDQNGVCDGNSQEWISSCTDGSDESDCKDKCPKAFRFPCEQTGCVDLSKACDGTSDCDDGSDEKNCGAVNCTSPANPERVPCDDGSKCVTTDQVCDGEPQCADSSDETKCTQERCGVGRYVCNGGTACIWLPYICNGAEDCPEGDDEGDCDQQRCQQSLGSGMITMRSDFLTCEEGKNCISRFEVCDGDLQDWSCPTGSDEENCDVDECADAPCQNDGVCVDVKAGYRCDCTTAWSGQDCDQPV